VATMDIFEGRRPSPLSELTRATRKNIPFKLRSSRRRALFGSRGVPHAKRDESESRERTLPS